MTNTPKRTALSQCEYNIGDRHRQDSINASQMYLNHIFADPVSSINSSTVLIDNIPPEGLSNDQKITIRKNADSLPENNRFHDRIFLDSLLNSQDFSQEVSGDGKVTYTYGSGKRKFVVGVGDHKDERKEMSDADKQNIVKWMLGIQGVAIPEDQTLIQYLRENKDKKSLQDIPRIFYSLGFKGGRIKLGKGLDYYMYMDFYDNRCEFKTMGCEYGSSFCLQNE